MEDIKYFIKWFFKYRKVNKYVFVVLQVYKNVNDLDKLCHSLSMYMWFRHDGLIDKEWVPAMALAKTLGFDGLIHPDCWKEQVNQDVLAWLKNELDIYNTYVVG